MMEIYLYWAMTIAGSTLAGLGLYLLGRFAAGSEVRSTRNALKAAQDKIKELMDLNRFHQLQDEIVTLAQSSPGAGADLSDKTAAPAPPAQPRKVRDLMGTDPNASLPPESREFHSTSGEIVLSPEARSAASEAAGKNPFDEDDGSGLTRKISLDSTQDMLTLSDHVDLLTEDLSRAHRELSTNRIKIGELEAQNSEKRKKINDLENLAEKLRTELKRRDEKLRNLMNELGVAFTSGEMADAINALESAVAPDVTAKMRTVEINELEVAAVAAKFKGGDKPDLDTGPAKGGAPSAETVVRQTFWPEDPHDAKTVIRQVPKDPEQEATEQGSSGQAKGPRVSRTGVGLGPPPPPLPKLGSRSDTPPKLPPSNRK